MNAHPSSTKKPLARIRHTRDNSTPEDPTMHIVITTTSRVPMAPGVPRQALVCAADSPRYAEALATLRAYGSRPLIEAAGKDALREAVEKNQKVNDRFDEHKDARLWMAEMSEVCADVIQHAAETLKTHMNTH